MPKYGGISYLTSHLLELRNLMPIYQLQNANNYVIGDATIAAATFLFASCGRSLLRGIDECKLKHSIT
jgi:hypothetical protein